MKKILLIALLLPLGVVSCGETKLEKPFVIINKSLDLPVKGEARYTYQDKNGAKTVFTDVNNKYSIGDTIK